MGLLLDQFIEATHKWQDATEDAERKSNQNGIVLYVMFWTGGSRLMRPIGGMDERTLTVEQLKTISVGELRGHYTIDQMRDHLEKLDQRLIQEPFMIVALVRAVEDEFEKMVSSYEAGIAHNQNEARELREIDADPERKAAYLQNLVESTDKLIAKGTLPPDTEPISEDTLKHFAEMHERYGQYSPKEKAHRQQLLDVWREVTQDLMSPNNLDRATKEWFDRKR